MNVFYSIDASGKLRERKGQTRFEGNSKLFVLLKPEENQGDKK